jgi:hypothetical protein
VSVCGLGVTQCCWWEWGEWGEWRGEVLGSVLGAVEIVVWGF